MPESPFEELTLNPDCLYSEKLLASSAVGFIDQLLSETLSKDLGWV